MNLIDTLRPVAKAVAGALVSALLVAIPAVEDGNGVSAGECLWIAASFLIGLGAVYVAPANRPKL